MSTTVQPTDFAGRLIITWPKPNGGMIAGHGIVLTDADTGEQIFSALDLDLRIRAAVHSVAVVGLTMLVDGEGKPLPRGGQPVLSADGEDFRTGVFWWWVAEMRIADE